MAHSVGANIGCGVDQQDFNPKSFAELAVPHLQTWTAPVGRGEVGVKADQEEANRDTAGSGAFLSHTADRRETSSLTQCHHRLHEHWWHFSEGPQSGSTSHTRGLPVHAGRGRGDMHKVVSEHAGARGN